MSRRNSPDVCHTWCLDSPARRCHHDSQGLRCSAERRADNGWTGPRCRGGSRRDRGQAGHRWGEGSSRVHPWRRHIHPDCCTSRSEEDTSRSHTGIHLTDSCSDRGDLQREETDRLQHQRQTLKNKMLTQHKETCWHLAEWNNRIHPHSKITLWLQLECQNIMINSHHNFPKPSYRFFIYCHKYQRKAKKSSNLRKHF